MTALEFDLIFDVLRSLETYKSVKGRITLFKIVIDQIGLDQPFPVSIYILFFLFFNFFINLSNKMKSIYMKIDFSESI